MHLLNPNSCIQWTLFDEAMEAASGRPSGAASRPKLGGTPAFVWNEPA